MHVHEQVEQDQEEDGKGKGMIDGGRSKPPNADEHVPAKGKDDSKGETQQEGGPRGRLTEKEGRAKGERWHTVPISGMLVS